MDTRRLAISLVGSVCLAAGCVPVPSGMVKDDSVSIPITPEGVFPGLDPGAKELASLHFQIRAYGTEHSRQISDMAEEQYNRIMTDTGLYSFKPLGLYVLIVYANKDEFAKKTRQPEWSGGVSVGNSIYTYEGPQLPLVLAHEMSHLLFHEYMASPRLELRWLNEGLAVYEETVRVSSLGGSTQIFSEQHRLLRGAPIPFDQMVTLVPATERERSVSLWYYQVGGVVKFLIERGGRNGFSQLLALLKDGRDIDNALRASFPGVWNGMTDLESAWKRSL